jgi:shikimate kinase
MGSGKTTLGSRLAARCGCEFVDLDVRLEVAAGCDVRTLMREIGEARFRSLELAMLREVAAQPPGRSVVATGGGIVETPEAWDLLRSMGHVVWLRADPHACVSRLGAERAARPLLDSTQEWRVRWARREPLYRQLADDIVETHPQDVEECLARLAVFLSPPAAGS